MKSSILHTATAAALSLAALGVSLPLQAQDEYWRQRYTLFEKLDVGATDIVFLGNSITDGGEFQELFGMDNVLNRGIRSDRIDGVRKRLKQVTKGTPAKIFLLIGINDVADSNNTVEALAEKYERLVKEIRSLTPSTTLYLQSVMPVNNDFRRYKSLIGREGIIPPFNEEIKRIALDNGAVYIDLWPVLADPSTGKMRREFTNDGLHLTGAGYRAWTEAVRPYVDSTVSLPGRDQKPSTEPEEESMDATSEDEDVESPNIFILNKKE